MLCKVITMPCNNAQALYLILNFVHWLSSTCMITFQATCFRSEIRLPHGQTIISRGCRNRTECGETLMGQVCSHPAELSEIETCEKCDYFAPIDLLDPAYPWYKCQTPGPYPTHILCLKSTYAFYRDIYINLSCVMLLSIMMILGKIWVGLLSCVKLLYIQFHVIFAFF